MGQVAAPARATRGAPRWRVLAVLLGILALASAGGAWARHNPESEPSSRGVAPPGSSAAADPPSKAPGTRPTGLKIPAIDVSATVTPMGLNPDRTVEVPRNPDNVGWYSLGSLPGQAGSAVLLGHVDSKLGPAVFSRLRSLKAGAKVEVRGADGTVSRFVVTRIATYANEDFPAREVYRAQGRPGLALVTCGGRYDASRGGYQANVVVFATLVTSTAQG